jgi:hypothetical protein
VSSLSSSEIEVLTWVPSAELTLLNHTGAVIASSSGGSLHAHGLDAGLYRVQVEAGPTVTEELVTVHEGASVVHHVRLLLPLATPVKGAAINHEIHAVPVQQLSVNPTLVLGAGGRLVVFIRATHRFDEPPPVGGAGLALLAADSGILLPQPLPTVQGPGCAGLSVDLSQGTYLLRAPVEGGRTADQSVVILPGWTTYLFLPAAPPEGGAGPWTPVPSAMVAHMKELGQAFEPYDYGSDAFFAGEMALDGLRAGQLVLPMGGWDTVLAEPQLNPMLAVYLGQAALVNSAPPLDALTELVQRLRSVVPGHPDAEALRCALLDRAGDRSASGAPPLTAPPMLLNSYQALIARDAVEPALLVNGSLAELAATRQRADGVWLRWDSLTDADSQIELDVPTLQDAAAAIDAVVDASEEIRLPSTLRFERFRESFTRDLGISPGPRTSRAPRVSRELGRDTDYAAGDDVGEQVGAGESAGTLPPAEPAPITSSVLVSQDVAALAGVITRMAAHAAGTAPATVADLSRQLGLPVSTVRAGLIEIVRASEANG